MLSKSLFSLLFLGVASSVSAVYQISTPGTGVVWKANDQAQVKWQGTDEPKVDVRLVHGPASNLVLYKVLCSDVDSSTGSCSYTVENNIPSGSDYAVTVGKNPANYGYSSYFTIQSQGAVQASNGCPNMGGNNCTASLPCCSSAGYCGSSDAYCGTGCQAKYSFNGVCGTSSSGSSSSGSPSTPPSSSQGQCGSATCTSSSPCCSQYNYCGSTSAHCGTGCQAGKSFAGKCVAPGSSGSSGSPSTPPSSSQGQCGSATCSSSSPCCSQYNYCGSTSAHCGTGCQPGKSFAGKCVAPKQKRILQKRVPMPRVASSIGSWESLRQMGRLDCWNSPNLNDCLSHPPS